MNYITTPTVISRGIKMGPYFWELPVKSQDLGALFVNTGTPKGQEGVWPTGFDGGLT